MKVRVVTELAMAQRRSWTRLALVPMKRRKGEDEEWAFGDSWEIGDSNKRIVTVRVLNNFLRNRIEESSRRWKDYYEDVEIPMQAIRLIEAVQALPSIKSSDLAKLNSLKEVAEYVAVRRLVDGEAES